MQKADAASCPEFDDTRILIEESEKPVEASWSFPGVLPDDAEDAENWHCKWKLDVDSSLIPTEKSTSGTLEEREENGWIVLEAETMGFDRDVVVVMQPHGKFYDFNARLDATDPNTQTYVGLSRAGKKFVLPAEYDIFFDVSPYKLNSDSDFSEGEDLEVKFTVYHTMENPVPEDANPKDWGFAERLEQVEIEEETEETPETEENDEE